MQVQVQVQVLVLGGTGEARELAGRLHARGDVRVTSSLAGRVQHPVLPPGAVRSGGFGGVDGLAAHLTATRVDAVVDATHPFAVTISAHAVAACARVGVPLAVLHRPAWTAGPDDRWHRVPTLPDAAAVLAAGAPRVVLLATGRGGTAAFAADDRCHYLVRSVEPPAGPLPARHTLLPARGPHTPDAERALLLERRVEVVVCKDSGGAAGVAKLVAARQLGLPVVMVDRPAAPAGPTGPTPPDPLTSVPDVERWLLAQRLFGPLRSF